MAESEEPKLVGARHHKTGCMCRMCLRVREMWAKGEEKRRKGLPVRKSSRNITRQGFVQAYTDPNRADTFGKPGNAALSAGYAEGTGDYLLGQPQVQDAVRAAMERAGLTEDRLFGKLNEGLDATETKFFADKGEVIESREVVDFHTRHKYIETAHKLRGDFPKDEPVQLASLVLKIGSGPATPEEWERIAAREQKVGSLLSERLEQEGYPADPDEYSRWRKEAEAKVRAELATPKAPKESGKTQSDA